MYRLFNIIIVFILATPNMAYANCNFFQKLFSLCPVEKPQPATLESKKPVVGEQKSIPVVKKPNNGKIRVIRNKKAPIQELTAIEPTNKQGNLFSQLTSINHEIVTFDPVASVKQQQQTRIIRRVSDKPKPPKTVFKPENKPISEFQIEDISIESVQNIPKKPKKTLIKIIR